MLGKENLHITKSSVICSDHFAAESIERNISGRKFLKKDAIPFVTAGPSRQPPPSIDQRPGKRPRLETFNVRDLGEDIYAAGSSKRTTHYDAKLSTSSSTASAPELENLPQSITMKQELATHYDAQSSSSSSTASAPELKNLPQNVTVQHELATQYDPPSSSSSSTASAPELENLQKQNLFLSQDPQSSETETANDNDSISTISVPQPHEQGSPRASQQKKRRKLRYFKSPKRAKEGWEIAKKTVAMQRKKAAQQRSFPQN
ncbi:unnamed protein product [Callosobruchus maculatus]|uniref:THAP-type domain-containing protein n=1 Tax=Callosobruchus maculatus TaxID=64391 RepID=A0A653CFY3_CALMS|nr:unnamed protein product [Callosobruchus maculatus]